MDGGELAWILAAGAATALGGLALLVFPRPRERTLDALLGFTAGVMLAATAFSLLVPGLEEGTVGEVVTGLLVGAAVLAVLDRAVPHVHARMTEEGRPLAAAEARARLLLAALTIHNVPEGIAVGIAFAAGGSDLGVPVAVAIGLQNVPEGFAAAAPLLAAGRTRLTAIGFAAATGAVEPPAALLAYAFAEQFSSVLPLALGFAAGAMLYVVVDELVPESHARGHGALATYALVGGFAVMLVLDTVLA